MNVVLCCIGVIIVAFLTYAAYCCVVVGSEADKRDKELFEKYMREKNMRK